MGVYRRFGAKFSYLKIFTDKMQGDNSYISSVIPISQIILNKIDKKIIDGRETALIEDFYIELKLQY